jgi:hypothetical protein
MWFNCIATTIVETSQFKRWRWRGQRKRMEERMRIKKGSK